MPSGKIKPCPFCWSEEHKEAGDFINRGLARYVRCKECKATGPMYVSEIKGESDHDAWEKAYALWEQRNGT